MKTEINIIPKKNFTYPCIMRYKSTEMVVLFLQPNVGTVIATGSSETYNLLEFSNNWDMDKFEYINGSITITNE